MKKRVWMLAASVCVSTLNANAKMPDYIFPETCMMFFHDRLVDYGLYPKPDTPNYLTMNRTRARDLRAPGDHILYREDTGDRYESRNGYFVDMFVSGDKKSHTLDVQESGPTLKGVRHDVKVSYKMNQKCEITEIKSPSGKSYKYPQCAQYNKTLLAYQNAKTALTQALDTKPSRTGEDLPIRSNYLKALTQLQTERNTFLGAEISPPLPNLIQSRKFPSPTPVPSGQPIAPPAGYRADPDRVCKLVSPQGTKNTLYFWGSETGPSNDKAPDSTSGHAQ